MNMELTDLDFVEKIDDLPFEARNGTRIFVQEKGTIFECWNKVWSARIYSSGGPSAMLTERLVIEIRSSKDIEELKTLYGHLDEIKNILERRILGES